MHASFLFLCVLLSIQRMGYNIQETVKKERKKIIKRGKVLKSEEKVWNKRFGTCGRKICSKICLKKSVKKLGGKLCRAFGGQIEWTNLMEKLVENLCEKLCGKIVRNWVKNLINFGEKIGCKAILDNCVE